MTFDSVRAKLEALMETRGPQYATADLQVSLEAPSGSDEASGAPSALVAYRCHMPRVPCKRCPSPA